MLFSRIIYQDIQAPKIGGSGVNDLLAKFCIANIACHRNAATPGLLYQFSRFFRILMLIKIRESDVRTFFCKCNGNRSSNTAIPTGN